MQPPASSPLAQVARAAAEALAASNDDALEVGAVLDKVTAELRNEKRLRQRAQADVLGLLAILSGIDLNGIVDADDRRTVARIEKRWTEVSE